MPRQCDIIKLKNCPEIITAPVTRWLSIKAVITQHTGRSNDLIVTGWMCATQGVSCRHMVTPHWTMVITSGKILTQAPLMGVGGLHTMLFPLIL